MGSGSESNSADNGYSDRRNSEIAEPCEHWGVLVVDGVATCTACGAVFRGSLDTVVRGSDGGLWRVTAGFTAVASASDASPPPVDAAEVSDAEGGEERCPKCGGTDDAPEDPDGCDLCGSEPFACADCPPAVRRVVSARHVAARAGEDTPGTVGAAVDARRAARPGAEGDARPERAEPGCRVEETRGGPRAPLTEHERRLAVHAAERAMLRLEWLQWLLLAPPPGGTEAWLRAVDREVRGFLEGARTLNHVLRTELGVGE